QPPGLPSSSTQKISIHASTWDATELSDTEKMILGISIHASTWDATLKISITDNDGKIFQST
ncbi:hypothetical protein MH216_03570, partial [Paenibacillus larvae]|uniref:hypothetical protein n=1 Tax=Paenibacillus larvae TaxID=1464 RepID=UPI002282FC07